jgi:hypothetical protein
MPTTSEEARIRTNNIQPCRDARSDASGSLI